MKKAISLTTAYILKNGLLIPLRSNPVKLKAITAKLAKRPKRTAKVTKS